MQHPLIILTSLPQEDRVHVLHEVLHTVADENPVDPVVLCVPGHRGPVVPQVQQMDFRELLAQEGDVVAIVAGTTGTVSAPASKLADLIEKTGNPVSPGNSVAAVAVNETLVKLAGGAEVKVLSMMMVPSAFL